MNKSFAHWCIFLLLMPMASPAFGARLERLRTEYTETPLGIDVERPRFSWAIAEQDPKATHIRQTAWQIVVTDERNDTVWDSGRTNQSRSHHIMYAGKALQPTTRYVWHVSSWLNTGERLQDSSWFETGLMNPAPAKAWDDAKWIGADESQMMLYPQYLPVFQLTYDIRIHKGSDALELLFGMNDQRLLNRNRNHMGVQSAQDSSYIAFAFDISPLKKGKQALLRVTRSGYAPTDRPSTLLKEWEIPDSVVDASNRHSFHRISAKAVLGKATVYIDGVRLGDVKLTPLGTGGDFIAFPVVGDMGVRAAPRQKGSIARLSISNFRTPGCQLQEITPLNGEYNGGKKGIFKKATPATVGLPMLRRVFSTSPTRVRKARLYVTARGVYDLYLNGKRVNDDYLNPGSTQYNKTHLYNTYDVTRLLQQGDRNAMGVILSEGWWAGAATFVGDNWNFFGDRPSLLAKLVIDYADGLRQVVTSQPREWRYTTDGPVRSAGLFQGEVYDATKEISGWSSPKFDDSAWNPAVEIPLEGTTALPAKEFSDMKLVGQYAQGIYPVKEVAAVSVSEPRPGLFIYDMGQNLAGVPDIRFAGLAPGTEVNLRFAEVLYPALPEYGDNAGTLMLENIRAAMAQDKYIAHGGEERFSPRFTYHGYRYIEITGIDQPLPPAAVRSTVLSSIDRINAGYTSSSPLLNRLWENICWSSGANFMSVPTDCPQRNERLGWAGDISVFSRTATYLADVPQFLRRYLQAMRDMQREDGRFPDVTPTGVGFGGLLWGSAGITVPWETYLQYGDTATLAEHYDAMARYMEYIRRKTIDPQTGIIVQRRQWSDLADWLGPEDGANDKSLLWECYYIYDLDIMSQVASVLGKQADSARYRRLAGERRQFFADTYLDKDSGITLCSAYDPKRKGKWVDTQTSYVLPLMFHVVDGEMKEKLAAHLAASIERSDTLRFGTRFAPYSLLTGFIGTAWVSSVLSDNGHPDVAYRLLMNERYPSWLYPVTQGATTIWERLNSYTHLNGFGGNNRMNSFNHYSFGAVGTWLCSHSLGIKRDEEPNFHSFRLEPEPDPTGQLQFAEGYYDSMYGRIYSRWEIGPDTVRYDFEIPANTTARLRIAASSEECVHINGTPLAESKNATHIGCKDGFLTGELGSGRYCIHVKVLPHPSNIKTDKAKR